MPKLSDLQRVLLAAAARRDDGALLPLPKRIAVKPNVLPRVLQALQKKKLVQERPAPADAVAWRETDDGQRFMLVVTPAGLEAIGVATDPTDADKDVKSETNAKRPGKSGTTPKQKIDNAAPVRAGTKIALLIDLLQRPEGASIAEIVEATGWQQHSVRGAISGTLKKKHGLAVTSAPVEDRGRVYRIATEKG